MQESAATHVDAPPGVVLARLTDVARLLEWNAAITEVVEQPEHLAPGAVWKVRMRALGRSWVSTSTVVTIGEAAGVFRYRSQTDDGNPSHADWEWRVKPDGAGSSVAVTVVLNPETFWRRYLLVHIRRPVLRREMQASLAALARAMSGLTRSRSC